MTEFKTKYIAFIDILGFKSLITKAENGEVSIGEIKGILRDLGNLKFAEELKHYRPICPESEHIETDLSFRITQCSDSTLASCEVSPSGLVHIIDYTKQVVFKMMKKGIMCRGYIDKGTIYHEEDYFFGTGFHRVCKKELTADAFKKYEEERNTPYVKLDERVLDDLDNCSDQCAKKIANRFIKRIENEAVISPWKIFELLMNGMAFNEEAAEGIRAIQSDVEYLRAKVREYISESNISVMAKFDHYNEELDQVLVKCDEAIALSQVLKQPFPARTLSDLTKK